MKTVRNLIQSLATLALVAGMLLASQTTAKAACLAKASTSYSGEIQGYTAGAFENFPYSTCTATFASPNNTAKDVRIKLLYNDHDYPNALHVVLDEEYNTTYKQGTFTKFTCGDVSYMMALVVLKDCWTGGIVSGCCGCVNYAKVASWDLD